MATLASKLKKKMDDQEKSKSPTKRPYPDNNAGSSSDDKCHNGESAERKQKLEDEVENDEHVENALEGEIENDETIENAKTTENDESTDTRKDNAKQMTEPGKKDVEQWKLDRKKSKLKALESDRVEIRKRMPAEVILEVFRIQSEQL